MIFSKTLKMASRVAGMKCNVISTRSKSSIRPSFFSRSEFLLFSIAVSFSIVRSDYRVQWAQNNVKGASFCISDKMQCNKYSHLTILYTLYVNCLLSYTRVKSSNKPARPHSVTSTCVALWSMWREAGFSEHDECSVLAELTEEGLPCCTWEADTFIH